MPDNILRAEDLEALLIMVAEFAAHENATRDTEKDSPFLHIQENQPFTDLAYKLAQAYEELYPKQYKQFVADHTPALPYIQRLRDFNERYIESNFAQKIRKINANYIEKIREIKNQHYDPDEKIYPDYQTYRAEIEAVEKEWDEKLQETRYQALNGGWQTEWHNVRKTLEDLYHHFPDRFVTYQPEIEAFQVIEELFPKECEEICERPHRESPLNRQPTSYISKPVLPFIRDAGWYINKIDDYNKRYKHRKFTADWLELGIQELLVAFYHTHPVAFLQEWPKIQNSSLMKEKLPHVVEFIIEQLKYTKPQLVRSQAYYIKEVKHLEAVLELIRKAITYSGGFPRGEERKRLINYLKKLKNMGVTIKKLAELEEKYELEETQAKLINELAEKWQRGETQEEYRTLFEEIQEEFQAATTTRSKLKDEIHRTEIKVQTELQVIQSRLHEQCLLITRIYHHLGYEIQPGSLLSRDYYTNFSDKKNQNRTGLNFYLDRYDKYLSEPPRFAEKKKERMDRDDLSESIQIIDKRQQVSALTQELRALQAEFQRRSAFIYVNKNEEGITQPCFVQDAEGNWIKVVTSSDSDNKIYRERALEVLKEQIKTIVLEISVLISDNPTLLCSLIPVKEESPPVLTDPFCQTLQEIITSYDRKIAYYQQQQIFKEKFSPLSRDYQELVSSRHALSVFLNTILESCSEKENLGIEQTDVIRLLLLSKEKEAMERDIENLVECKKIFIKQLLNPDKVETPYRFDAAFTREVKTKEDKIRQLKRSGKQLQNNINAIPYYKNYQRFLIQLEQALVKNSLIINSFLQEKAQNRPSPPFDYVRELVIPQLRKDFQLKRSSEGWPEIDQKATRPPYLLCHGQGEELDKLLDCTKILLKEIKSAREAYDNKIEDLKATNKTEEIETLEKEALLLEAKIFAIQEEIDVLIPKSWLLDLVGGTLIDLSKYQEHQKQLEKITSRFAGEEKKFIKIKNIFEKKLICFLKLQGVEVSSTLDNPSFFRNYEKLSFFENYVGKKYFNNLISPEEDQEVADQEYFWDSIVKPKDIDFLESWDSYRSEDFSSLEGTYARAAAPFIRLRKGKEDIERWLKLHDAIRSCIELSLHSTQGLDGCVQGLEKDTQKNIHNTLEELGLTPVKAFIPLPVEKPAETESDLLQDIPPRRLIAEHYDAKTFIAITIELGLYEAFYRFSEQDHSGLLSPLQPEENTFKKNTRNFLNSLGIKKSAGGIEAERRAFDLLDRWQEAVEELKKQGYTILPDKCVPPSTEPAQPPPDYPKNLRALVVQVIEGKFQDDAEIDQALFHMTEEGLEISPEECQEALKLLRESIENSDSESPTQATAFLSPYPESLQELAKQVVEGKLQDIAIDQALSYVVQKGLELNLEEYQVVLKILKDTTKNKGNNKPQTAKDKLEKIAQELLTLRRDHYKPILAGFDLNRSDFDGSVSHPKWHVPYSFYMGERTIQTFKRLPFEAKEGVKHIPYSPQKYRPEQPGAVWYPVEEKEQERPVEWAYPTTRTFEKGPDRTNNMPPRPIDIKPSLRTTRPSLPARVPVGTYSSLGPFMFLTVKQQHQKPFTIRVRHWARRNFVRAHHWAGRNFVQNPVRMQRLALLSKGANYINLGFLGAYVTKDLIHLGNDETRTEALESLGYTGAGVAGFYGLSRVAPLTATYIGMGFAGLNMATIAIPTAIIGYVILDELSQKLSPFMVAYAHSIDHPHPYLFKTYLDHFAVAYGKSLETPNHYCVVHPDSLNTYERFYQHDISRKPVFKFEALPRSEIYFTTRKADWDPGKFMVYIGDKNHKDITDTYITQVTKDKKLHTTSYIILPYDTTKPEEVVVEGKNYQWAYYNPVGAVTGGDYWTLDKEKAQAGIDTMNKSQAYTMGCSCRTHPLVYPYGLNEPTKGTKLTIEGDKVKLTDHAEESLASFSQRIKAYRQKHDRTEFKIPYEFLCAFLSTVKTLSPNHPKKALMTQEGGF